MHLTRSLILALLLSGCAELPVPETASNRAASRPYPALLPITDLIAATGTAPVAETSPGDLAARAAALRARADALR